MVLNIYKKIQQFLKRYLDIFAILFLVMNFVIWYLNEISIDTSKYSIYFQLIYLLLAGLLLNINRLDFPKFVKENIFFILIFIIGLYNSTSIIMEFNGIVVDMGYRSRVLLLEAMPSFLFILAAFKLVDKRAIIIGFNIIIFIVVGYSLLAILKQHFGLEKFLGIAISSTSTRHQSILNNPNVLGEYAFIGIFLSFFLSLINKKFWIKIVSLLPIPILIYGIILSGSRTALFMTLTLYLIINLYFIYYKNNSKLILIIGNIIFAIGVILVISGVFDTYIDMIRADMSLTGRDTIWMNSLKIIDENIFRGIGYNNFTYVYNELYNVLTSPHNMLIGVTTELGLLATILVVFWFVHIIIRNHNVIIQNKSNKLTTYLILFNVFYITYFIGQFTEYSFLKFSTINTLFLVLQGFNHNILSEFKNKQYNSMYNYMRLVIVLIVYLAIYNQTVQTETLFYYYMLIGLVIHAIVYMIIDFIVKVFIDKSIKIPFIKNSDKLSEKTNLILGDES